MVTFRRRAPRWRSLCARYLTRYVGLRGTEVAPRTLRDVVGHIRSFLRFLASVGHVPIGFERLLPRAMLRPARPLPPHLQRRDVDRLLKTCKGSTPVDVRDRAILLLLHRLGLRAGEAVRLTLDDIDWRAGTIALRETKTNVPRLLPLPHDVGNALARYIRETRPRSSNRQLFLTIMAPARPFNSGSALGGVVRARLRTARIKHPRGAAHLLRHSFATELARDGAGLKEIADLLGHDKLRTTSGYARLMTEQLAQVALPWPRALA